MKTVLVVLNVLGALLFAAFAYLQVNDTDAAVYVEASSTDAWLWVGFYALVAVLFAAAALGRHAPRIVLAFAVALCLFEMARSAPGLIENLRDDEFVMTGESMSPDNSKVELTREFGGAVIALAGVAFLFFQAGGCCRRSSAAPSGGRETAS